MTAPILVVGVGGDGPAGLSDDVRARIEAADLLCGGARLLALWPDHPAERVTLRADMGALVARLAARGDRRAVVLASGDPGFFGIAHTLAQRCGLDEIEIVPHVSALQVAFARAGISWHDAILTSAHARPLAEVIGWARRAPKLGILTDPVHTPAAIAQALLDAGLPDCRALVAENLETPEERLIDTRLCDLPGRTFAPLNVLLLVQDPGWRPRPGFAPRPEAAYAHRRGLITKADVRALVLARLALRETDTVWDVGAGSGAVSVDMAELAWRGHVYAVERDAENLACIRQNVARFGTLNVEVVAGAAPDALVGLPALDAVFIGGSGGAMDAILRAVDCAAPSGCRIAITLVTLETLAATQSALRDLGWPFTVTQVSLAHSANIAGQTRLVPLNPVFILAGGKP